MLKIGWNGSQCQIVGRTIACKDSYATIAVEKSTYLGTIIEIQLQTYFLGLT